MGRILITVLAAVLCASARAGPIQISYDPWTCTKSCTDRNKFSYVPRQTYQYKYDSDIKTLVQGASEDQASIHLSATVQLEVISKCDLSLQLKDVALTEYDPDNRKMKEVNSEFKVLLERFPVRMSYQDGGVEELCLTGDEPTWVLNVKRGLISLIQNNMDDFRKNHTTTEIDVSGVCDTEYFTKDSSRSITSVGKSKNLLSCTDRHGYNTAIQGIPYTSDSDIQSLPLLKSDHNCVHEIDTRTRILKSVKCEERHMFRPFSNDASGAVTVNTQTLSFIRFTTGTRPPTPIMNRVSLKFDHINDPAVDDRTRKDITRRLLEICEKTKSGVAPETPRLFTELVYLMKSADKDTVSGIYKVLNEEKICPDNIYRTRKFFLDALPLAGTSASVHLITELITSKVVTGLEAEMWLTSLAFIKKPNKDMLREAKPLINMDDTGEKAMLSVGTLVHSYCYHYGNCEKDDLVKAIISAFVNKMVTGCKVTGENMKTTLMALRGLGNAGYASSAIPQLEVCMQVATNPVEIRLSAIEAFRRMPCESDRSVLMSILQNKEEDSEIRIAAYRVLMECPSSKVLQAVRNTLAKEEVNQVGSYIWTHLTNLIETSDRHKQDIRSLLEDETLAKEFDLDQRKFSRNYEKSIFIEKINTGAKVEGDVIWSSKSFIPRSAMVNLTFDLFGHSVNLFEVGGRAEGLEYFLESFFGPNGYFGQSAQETSKSDILPKNINEDKISKIDKRFSAKMAELRGSMYMRVFGNELRYMNFIGLNDILLGSNVNILDMLLNMAEENDLTYSHSTMFLDSSFIVPTSSGFPLNLTVNGTAMIDLRVKGKMDFKNMDISGLIHPSAAIDISSMMSVDAFVTKTGIKMVSTLHTSTSIQGRLTIDKDGSLSAEYEMPEPRMEIIDVRSSFFTVHRDSEREQKMLTDTRNIRSLCSPERLVTITGLELCAEVSYPDASLKNDAPYFPMNGPVIAGVYLYRRDTHTKYQIQARSVHNKEANILHFLIDTPDSRIDRRIQVDFNLNKEDYSVDATLTSPWKKANLQGAVIMNKGSYGIKAKVNVDGMAPCSFKAQLDRDENGKSIQFSPTLEIVIPGRELMKIKGSLININNWKQIDLQSEMLGLIKSPITAKATIQMKPVLIGLEASLELSKDKLYSVDMNVNINANKKKVLYKPLVSIRTPAGEVLAFGGTTTMIFGKGVEVKLVLDKVFDKKVSLNGKVTLADNKRRVTLDTKVTFDSSPVNLDLKAKIDNRKFRAITTDIDFTYVIRNFARDKLKLVSKVNNLSSSSLTKLKAAVNFESAKRPDINFKVITEIDHNKKQTKMDGDVWYGKDFKNDANRVELRLEMNRKFKSLMNAEADLLTRLKFPALGLSMMMKGAHSHDERNLNSSFTAKFGKGQPIEMSLRIQDKTERLMKIEMGCQLAFDGFSIVMDHDLEQKNEVLYISTLNAQRKKAQKDSIITQIRTENGKIDIDSQMNFFEYGPVALSGEFSLEPSDFVTSLTFEKDSKKYSGSVRSATEIGKSSWMTVDLIHPNRHFILSVGGRKIDDVFFGDAKLQLDETQTFTVNGWFETPTLEKVNGSLLMSLPKRNLTLTAYYTQGSKSMAHADFQWAPEAKIFAETTLDIMDQRIFGNAIVITTFDSLPQAKLTVDHHYESEEYKTLSEFAWGKDDMLSVDSTIKKPVSLESLVALVNMKSSSIDILKRITIDINHKLSDSLVTSAKLGWNRDFVEADIALQNTSKGTKLGFEGNIDIKTSFQYVKKGNLKISHSNDGVTFNTDLSASRNKKQYSITSKIINQPSQESFASSGFVNITAADGNYNATWQHRHTYTDVATYLKTSWDKSKEMTIRLSGKFKDSLSVIVDVQTPFDVARDAKFDLLCTIQNNALSKKSSLTVNGKQVGYAEIGYSNGEKIKTAGIALRVPDLNVHSELQAELRNPIGGMLAANISLMFTPAISLSIEGTQNAATDKTVANTIILWKSTFPGYEQVQFSYEVLADSQLVTVTQLEYSTNKLIRLETAFLFDSLENMKAAANLTTPFDVLRKVQGSISFQGNLDALTSETSLEIQPYFDKVSAKFSLGTRSNLIASLRIDLPLTEYNYFQADFNGKIGRMTSDVMLKIEYIPGRIVQFRVNHLMTETNFIMNAKGSSPFGSIFLKHQGTRNNFTCTGTFEIDSNKKYGIDVKFSNTANISASMKISLYGRRDISAVFSHAGDATNSNIHAEIQHNRKNNFVSDLRFNLRNEMTVEASTSLRTQLISETEEYTGRFSLVGMYTKFTTHGEFSTTQLGKSEFDLSADLTGRKEGHLVINSTLIRAIKASFTHFQQPGLVQSDVEIVHDRQNILKTWGSLSTQGSIVLHAGLENPWMDAVTVMTRYDGKIEDFVIRSEGTYGDKKVTIDISSLYNLKNVNQKVTVKATSMKDISAEFLFTGDILQMKTFAELNYGEDRHRLDVKFSNIKSLNASFTFNSPLTIPISAVIESGKDMKYFSFHSEILISSDKSVVDVSLTTVDKYAGQISIRSHLIPVSVISFEHEGNLRNFRTHGEYNIGSKTTSIDIIYSGISRYEGLLTIRSHLMEYFSVGFEHSGTVRNFKSHGEYTYGSEKRVVDWSVDLENKVDVNIRYNCPKHGISLATYRHTGSKNSFDCHAELATMGHRIGGNFTFQSKKSLRFQSYFTPSSSSSYKAVTMTFEHSGAMTNFCSHGEFYFGQDRASGDLSLINEPKHVALSVQFTSSFAKTVSLNLKTVGNIKDFSSSLNFSLDSDRTETNMTMKISDESLLLTVTTSSPYFDGVNGRLKVNGSLQESDITATLTKGFEEYEGAFSHSLRNKIMVKGEIKIPMDGYKVLGASYEHIGSLRNFECNGRFKVEDKENEMTVQFDAHDLGNVKGTCDIVSAYFAPVSFRIAHSSTSSQIIVTFNGRKHSLVDLNKTPSGYSLTSEIILPSGSNRMEAKWSSGKKMAATFSLNSPLTPLILAKVDFSGSLSNFSGSSTLSIDKKESAHVAFCWTSVNKLSATFSVNIPLIDLNKISGELTLTQRDKAFAVYSKLLSASDKLLDITLDIDLNRKFLNITLDSSKPHLLLAKYYFSSTGNQLKSAMELNHESQKIVNGNIELTGDMRNFQARGKLEYSNRELIDFHTENSLIGMLSNSRIHVRSAFTDEIIITAKHEGGLDNFRTETSLQLLKNIYRMDASFKLKPVTEGSVALTTPFKNFEDVRAAFSYGGGSGSILTTGEVQYAPRKNISAKLDLVKNGWSYMMADISLKMPFDGMERNQVTYTHTVDSDSFSCKVDSTVMGETVRGTLSASRAPYNLNLDLKTPFDGFETIGFGGNFLSNRRQYSGKIEANWNAQSKIAMGASLSLDRPWSGSLSVVTPFEYVKEVSVSFSEQFMSTYSLKSVQVIYNGRILIDADLEHTPLDLSWGRRHVKLTIRSPWPMMYELDGEFTELLVDFDMTADWDSSSADSNVKLEANYDSRTEKSLNIKLTQSRRPNKVISFKGTLNLQSKSSTANFLWGLEPTEKAGYSIKIGDHDGTVKLVLPSRSLEITGVLRGRVTEGSFLWDADVDSTRRITMRSVTVSGSGVVKSDVTVSMPSFGKNIKISSELAANQARIIFSGKTEIAYSGDSSRNIVMFSKLEDISTPGNQNYSFSFGLNHPYSTVGVVLNSHAGKSDTGLSAAVGLEYLTVKQQTKKFLIGGRIDKVKKFLSFELQSPIKTISISGSAQTDSSFRLSLLNIYDQKQPLSTLLTVDRKLRSLELIHNYDLDDPSSEFHVSAKYVNSSAIAAEVYHVTSGESITDIIATMRLNNSHLIHSRLHWRPHMMKDLKAHIDRKLEDYLHRLHVTAERIEPDVAEEFAQKFRRIVSALEEEIGKENMNRVSAAVLSLLNSGLNTVVSASQPVVQQLNYFLTNSGAHLGILVDSYEDLKQLQQFQQLGSMAENLQTALPSLRQAVTDNVNFLSEKFNLPSRYIPEYTTDLVRQAVIDSGNMIPAGFVLEMVRTGLRGVDKSLESFIRDEIRKLEISVERFLRNAEQIILAHLKSPFTVYDPVHGEIQMELYSVIPLQSLDTLPELDIAKYIVKIERMIQDVLKSLPSIPDLTREWVPPFTGVAYVSKGQKITTFDGYIYDLENECTYILSRDYTDGNFSLILSNDGDTTLTVLTAGKPISISVKKDILLGNKVAAVPFQEGSVTVSKNDDNSINIKGGNHFNINYDLSIDYLTIEVSGWYHGRTGGLLGVYDNEPSNDIMTSYSKVIDNSDRFARTWEVAANSCR